MYIDREVQKLLLEIDDDTMSVVDKVSCLTNFDVENILMEWSVNNIINYMCKNYIDYVSNFVNLSTDGISDYTFIGPWKIET